MKAPTFGWLEELCGTSLRTGLALEQVHFRGRTRWQEVLIGSNSEIGRFLALDGQLQSAALDEFIYHESLVHPPLLLHPQPRRVLVLGGGEGATLREALKHPSVEKVTMVELDGELIDLCRQHLPEYSRDSFQDPRLELVVGDAWAWMISHPQKYDIILSDLTEPDEESHSQQLFSRQFFETARQRLAPGGILALQASNGSWGYLQRHRRVRQFCSLHFAEVHSLLVPIPSFGCSWGFLLARPEGDCAPLPSAEEFDRRVQERKVEGLRYLQGSTLAAALAHPGYIVDFLGR